MIRTRIAPSPTGPFHIGTARTALFNWLYAKQNGGEFILRLEDTDKTRSQKKFEDDIKEGLKWLGLNWDKEYRQSERFDIYRSHAEKLLYKGLARKDPSTSSGQGGAAIILKNQNSPITFNDLIRGEIKFEADALKEEVIIKSDGSPTYNFAAAVDDAEMQITHVIRGEDHISNTPKQIVIQKALGLTTPKYAHLPLILGSDRSKLSKRHGATSVNEYREQGFLSKAMINFMVLLGWHPKDDKEIFDEVEQLKELFSLDRVQQGGAVFDIEKLRWINQAHIKRMDRDDLKGLLLDFYPDKKSLITDGFVRLVHPRIKTLKEAESDFRWNEKPNQEDVKRIINLGKQPLEDVLDALSKSLDFLNSLSQEDLRREKLNKEILKFALNRSKILGETLHPLRIALSGSSTSPSPLELIDYLGKEKTIERVKTAIEKLKVV